MGASVRLRRRTTGLVVPLLTLTALVGTAPAGAVVNGSRVAYEDFTDRWQATVHLDSDAAGVCTGTVIDASWVLTAGHCVSGGPTTVRYGHSDWRAATPVVVEAQAVRVPPGVEGPAPDVALLELPEPIAVRPAALATAPTVEAGDTVDIAGWGLREEGGPLPDDLIEASLRIDARTDDVLYFTGGPAGPCSGDSGGPMVDPTTRVVVGVASFVVHGCTGTGGHVAVDAVLPWIQETVGGLTPVPRDDAYRGLPGEPLVVAADGGVLANDVTYAAAPVLTVVEAPLAGELDLRDDGSFTYVPDEGWAGLDTFDYEIATGTRSARASVRLVINQVPTAVHDLLHLELDPDTWSPTAVLVVPAPGVLANDTDPDGHGLTAQLVEDVTTGYEELDAEVTLLATGGFELLLEAEGVGVAAFLEVSPLSFTYQVSDGIDVSSPALVEVDLCAPGDCPDGEDPGDPPAPTLSVGGQLEELVAPTAAGVPWTLAEVTDDVVVLHLCAVDCTPCQDLARSLDGPLLDELEATYGATSFEIVEVLVGGLAGQPSTAAQAAAWSELSGGRVPVLHAGGSDTASVVELATAVGVSAYPTLVVLDRHRRVVSSDRPTSSTPFEDAIEHGLAVGDLPLDLASGQPPTGLRVAFGPHEATAGWPAPGETVGVSLADGSQLLVGASRILPTAGTWSWWSRREVYELQLVGVTVAGDAVAPLPAGDLTIALDGLVWPDGYPRELTASIEATSGTPDEAIWTAGPQVEAAVSEGGVTIGPSAGAWPEGTFAATVHLRIAPQLDAVVVEDAGAILWRLQQEVRAAGLPRGVRTPLLAKLADAQRLLSGGQADRAVVAALDGFVRQLGGARGVPSTLAEGWLADVDRVRVSLVG